jgi:predicted SprT family Zn-dependent metalloprotease
MIYDYRCKCGSTLQIERSIHEEASNPVCYDCHESMEKVWSSPPVYIQRFLAFYSTDNA